LKLTWTTNGLLANTLSTAGSALVKYTLQSLSNTHVSQLSTDNSEKFTVMDKLHGGPKTK